MTLLHFLGGETPILNDLFSDRELVAAFQVSTVKTRHNNLTNQQP